MPRFHAKMHFVENTVFSRVIIECHVMRFKIYPYSMKQSDPKRQPTQKPKLQIVSYLFFSIMNLFIEFNSL